MKAVLLLGGRGKRLRPITDYVPKPLIPLDNVPIIEWQIRYLKKFGIKEFILCIGYKNKQIKNFLQLKNNFDVKIHYSIEKTPLGTGGAIKRVSHLIKEKSFVVINGDTITNIDVRKLKSKPNSIAAIELRTNFGILNNVDDKVIGFDEKKEIPNLWMNAGIYHLSSKILKDLPKKGDIEKTTFPKYAKEKKLHLVKFRKVLWYSIDSYKDMEECSKIVRKIIK